MNVAAHSTPPAGIIGGDQALAIAQADALKAYRDLSAYRIQVVLEDDGWHVDYELKDPAWSTGGGRAAIACQRACSQRGLNLVSADRTFDTYGLIRIW